MLNDILLFVGLVLIVAAFSAVYILISNMKEKAFIEEIRRMDELGYDAIIHTDTKGYVTGVDYTLKV